MDPHHANWESTNQKIKFRPTDYLVLSDPSGLQAWKFSDQIKIPSLEELLFSSHSYYTYWFPGSPSSHICWAGILFHLVIIPKAGAPFPRDKEFVLLASKQKPLNRKVNNAKFIRKSNLIKIEWSKLQNKLSYITQKDYILHPASLPHWYFCLLSSESFSTYTVPCCPYFLSQVDLCKSGNQQVPWSEFTNFRGKSPRWVSLSGIYIEFPRWVSSSIYIEQPDKRQYWKTFISVVHITKVRWKHLAQEGKWTVSHTELPAESLWECARILRRCHAVSSAEI